jgi:hypothetical protein
MKRLQKSAGVRLELSKAGLIGRGEDFWHFSRARPVPGRATLPELEMMAFPIHAAAPWIGSAGIAATASPPAMMLQLRAGARFDPFQPNQRKMTIRT